MQFKGQRSITFTNLYGDKYAAFEGKATNWKRRYVIFPEGFVPEDGKEYVCEVYETLTGEFQYNGETFCVCRARWVDMATDGEVTLAQAKEKFPVLSNEPKPETAMERALRQAGLMRKGK